MSEVTPFDPYRSPSLPEGPYAGKSGSRRPQVLTALIIVCLVFGILGLMNSLFGVVGVIGGQQLQQAFQTKMPPGVDPRMQQAQDKFQADINNLQNKFRLEMIGTLALRFVAALLLVVGGIKALGKQESGRKLLVAACAVALAFELIQAIVQSLINTEMLTAFNSLTESTMQSLPDKPGAENVKRFVQTVMKISIYAAIGMPYILMAVKGGVYLFGLIYLRKPHVKELFQPA